MERRYRAALKTLDRNARELKKERRLAAALKGMCMSRPQHHPYSLAASSASAKTRPRRLKLADQEHARRRRAARARRW